jgi:hypothetical protein
MAPCRSISLVFSVASLVSAVPVDVEDSALVHTPLMNSTIQLMAELYKDLGNPHTFQEDKDNYQGHPVTYGEILPGSIMSISSQFENVTRSELDFYDLGSGAGKMCLQEFLQSGWKRSVGVELVTRRYKIAVGMLRKLEGLLDEDSVNGEFVRKSFGTDAKLTEGVPDEDADAQVCFGNKERELCFMNGDMTKVKGIKGAGGLFMCSTCFSDELLLTMMDDHFKYMPEGAVIVSLRELPNIHEDLERDHLALQLETQEDMSWSKADHVRVYKRLDDHSVTTEKLHTYHL